METTPEKLEMFYEGKAKKLYSTADPDLVIAYFKDDATAFNAKKSGTIEDKGVINNRMSELFFTLLERRRRQDAFRAPPQRSRDAVQAARRSFRSKPSCAISSPVRWRSGSAARKASNCQRPVVEYYYKIRPSRRSADSRRARDRFWLGDRRRAQDHPRLALRVNEVLGKFLDERGILLVDFKLEFGRYHGEILLGDEICPDTCRFWDKATRKKLDKDRFRRDLGDVEEAYQEMLRRVR